MRLLYYQHLFIDFLLTINHEARFDGSIAMHARDRRKARQFALASTVCVFSAAAAAAPTFERISPSPETYVFGFGQDYMQGQGAIADVTAQLFAVDLLLPPIGGSTSGCEAADFAGFAAGSIALLQRGTCNFNVKIDNAAAAGAVGALVFNEGNTPGRLDAIGVTYGTGAATIPWFFTSFAVGSELAALLGTGPVIIRMRTEEVEFGAAAVPEPATWAMMLLGLSAAGVALRRSKKTRLQYAA